eukprot:768013-Hanusia_phi.AAC.16
MVLLSLPSSFSQHSRSASPSCSASLHASPSSVLNPHLNSLCPSLDDHDSILLLMVFSVPIALPPLLPCAALGSASFDLSLKAKRNGFVTAGARPDRLNMPGVEELEGSRGELSRSGGADGMFTPATQWRHRRRSNSLSLPLSGAKAVDIVPEGSSILIMMTHPLLLYNEGRIAPCMRIVITTDVAIFPLNSDFRTNSTA